MKQVECNKCGKVFEVEGDWGYCPFCENDQVEVGKEERYKYVCKKIEYIDGYILEGKTANGFHLEYACNLLNQQDKEIAELEKENSKLRTLKSYKDDVKKVEVVNGVEFTQEQVYIIEVLKYNVVYTTITTLYESGNEYLQWVAIDYANEFLTKSRPEKSYDCGYYLQEYFKGEKL